MFFKMFKCGICSFSSQYLMGYVKHYQLHANVPNVTFPCVVAGCNNSFRVYNSLKSHILRQHEGINKVKDVNQIPVDCELCCNVALCNHKCDGVSKLIAHLKYHIRKGDNIICPFRECNVQFHNSSAFASHLSRLHQGWSLSGVNSASLLQPNVIVNSTVIESHPITQQNDERGIHDGIPLGENEEDDPLLYISESVPELNFEIDLLRKVALWLLTLQTKQHVPLTVIQTIVEELHTLHDFNAASVAQQVKSKLDNYKCEHDGSRLPTELVGDVINCISNGPIQRMLHTGHGPLRSNQTRQTFFKKYFSYVEPIAYKIANEGEDRNMYFHYVPILESLKALFKDPGIGQYLNKGQVNTSSDVLYDFQDGRVFRNKEFFIDNPDAIQIILYQDSFEVVNPLGSAKKKHKILAVYYSVGNLHASVRSLIDNMQLVVLCKEENFKMLGREAQDVVFGPLLNDLKKLESGVAFEDTHIVNGSLAFVLGDNLGSHMFGGFVESFSLVSHFCRYCLIPKVDLESGITSPRYYEARTVENYNAGVQEVSQGDRTHFQGVKFNSILNQLSYFHVTDPGLPPCLGHDLFEGVVKVDLNLILNSLQSKKYFSYDNLNVRIERFKFKGTEALDKPPKMNSKGISGHAVQVWCFLRMLPLLIGDKITNTNDPVWRLLLSLRLVVEFVCKISYSMSDIVQMNEIIEEYLILRNEVFPNATLKPKHHYLAHYPQLTIQCGPLIRLWTLRFESKHSFFKKCIRSSGNFINVTQSLSEKHQLFQAMYSAGSVFRNPLSSSGTAPYDSELVPAKMAQAIFHYPETFDDTNAVTCTNLTFNGITYKKNLIILLGRDSESETIHAGAIKLILLLNSQNIYFVVEKSSLIYMSWGVQN